MYKYLFYFRQFANLFDLEYFRNKLAAKAKSIATLEQAVMSGLNFWETQEEEKQPEESDEDEQDDDVPPHQKKKQKEEIPYSRQPESVEFRNKLAEQVAYKIQL